MPTHVHSVAPTLIRFRRKADNYTAALPNRQFVIAITDIRARRIYGDSIGRGRFPMLSTTFRQTRSMIHEWCIRARSRRELAMLGELDRHDLSRRFDVCAEIQKPFWQA
jgi:uncharacterized protein YjiS (DUF1127 family)